MNLLFIADPLEQFKTYKDTTYTMMREAARRGHALATCEPAQLAWQQGAAVTAEVRDVWLNPAHDPHTAAHEIHTAPNWFKVTATRRVALKHFDAVLMRKDPPFDTEYLYTTHLLEQAEREGARVFNRPRALREHPEKLAILEWPQFIAPTLVTRSAEDIRRFHAEQHDIILKPLDGMGGMGIFRVGADGLNLGSIIETLNRGGATTVMVQRYLPEITQGDKRVLIIGGEPVPYCLARIPQGNEIRGNLATGGKGVAQALTDTDRATAQTIGRALAPRGLLLIGLDIIGNRVTEINVTSPTCFQEIQDQTGCDVPAIFIDALERAVRDQG